MAPFQSTPVSASSGEWIVPYSLFGPVESQPSRVSILSGGQLGQRASVSIVSPANSCSIFIDVVVEYTAPPSLVHGPEIGSVPSRTTRSPG